MSGEQRNVGEAGYIGEPHSPVPSLAMAGSVAYHFAELQKVWPTSPGAPRLTGYGTGDIFFERWQSDSNHTFELTLESGLNGYALSLPLTQSRVIYSIGRQTVTDNEIYPGEPFLNGPISAHSRKIYHGEFDVFRVTLSASFLAERASYRAGRTIRLVPTLFGPHLNTDTVMQALLMAAGSAHDDHDCLYAESLGTAIADYLLGKYAAGPPKHRVSPLPKWQLARAIDYIEANLAHDITTAQLGSIVGVSRMHFAAQFKAAMGIPPHEYILARRVRAARLLILSRRTPIKNIAVEVGFKSPAHFAETFRRLVGESPSRWRDMVTEIRGQVSRHPETLGN